MKVVYWGTYDLGKPRNRILLRGLRENDVQVIECHKDLWQKVEDKSQIHGWRAKVFVLARWICSYPKLICRYLLLEKHDAVVVGYLGHLDVIMIWPFAKLRGAPLVWDAFLSLYDTVVNDRALLHRYHPLSVLIYAWEWIACRGADRVVLDTRSHANLFKSLYKVSEKKLGVAFVGAEPEIFSVTSSKALGPEICDQQFKVLFYGQFIPLHGIGTIVEAARLCQDAPVTFVIIGKGQEERRIQKILDDQPLTNLLWIPWVDYSDLIVWIKSADVCLGIFGDSAKASRVIPNKVFQVVAANKPIITRDSPAIRELLSPEMDAVTLVAAKDPVELAAQIRRLAKRRQYQGVSYPESIRSTITPQSIGRQMKTIINKVLPNRR